MAGRILRTGDMNVLEFDVAPVRGRKGLANVRQSLLRHCDFL